MNQESHPGDPGRPGGLGSVRGPIIAGAAALVAVAGVLGVTSQIGNADTSTDATQPAAINQPIQQSTTPESTAPDGTATPDVPGDCDGAGGFGGRGHHHGYPGGGYGTPDGTMPDSTPTTPDTTTPDTQSDTAPTAFDGNI